LIEEFDFFRSFSPSRAPFENWRHRSIWWPNWRL